MYLVHHYLQKGFTPKQILNLSTIDKYFYNASMLIELEQKEEEMKAMMGQGK